MFVDYLTVMIVNLVAGLALLAIHVVFFLDQDQKRLALGFLATGFISTVTGLHLTLTCPLPGANNIPIGELSLLFGVLFLVAGFALIFEWDLLGVAIVAAFAGFAAIIVGLRYFDLGMSRHPVMSGLGFIAAGLGAMLTVPAYFLKQSLLVRWIVALILVAAAVLWAISGYGGYWAHLESFAQYSPFG